MPDKKHVDITLSNGGVMRVEPLSPQAIRVRLRADGAFTEPSLVRYGVLHSNGQKVAFTVAQEGNAVVICTAGACVSVNTDDGCVTLKNAAGATLLKDAIAPWSGDEKGWGAEFSLAEGERLYGLGDVTREQIEKRGLRTRMWVTNVSSYVPIPFLMSSRGWAILLNTTWKHYWDLGHTDADRLRVWGNHGELDYTLFAGADYASLLDSYTDITGKPTLLPLWAYGLTFVCNQEVSAREMLDDCLNFRRDDIPCDVIGLEPGWMETNYDYSVDKKWHPERFYLPYWAPAGDHTFIAAANRLGFKLSLWLCCDYDLSFEEERQFKQAHPEEVKVQRSADDFEQDDHFMHPQYQDKLTKRDEAWFEHLKKFVDQGAAAFKLDGANQVIEHPDRLWGNGMCDDEMHNLYPTLLNKQMSLGFKEHTGRRSMIYSSGGYTGIQQYSATWAGDTGGGPKPLISMLNHGMSGHVNTSCDMDIFNPAGIHFGFFQPWSQLCSWAYWRHPWLAGEQLEGIFRDYAKLRYRLIPYIYSMAHVAAQTGLPIMRAMSLMYPNDPAADGLVNQYLFGDSLLVAAFTDQMHLPEGTWIDYWTGESYEGPQELTCTWPENRGGPLFVKAGAILPQWPEMDFTGQKPIEEIALDVYPQGASSFTLYEDDGESYAYREGAVATTQITYAASDGAVKLTIGPRVGEYEGMAERRTFAVRLHLTAAPQSVLVNGVGVAGQYDELSGILAVCVCEDIAREQPVVIQCR